MEKQFLEDCLAKGMSLETIGSEVGKHPSTVGYWMKKHELRALGAAKFAGRGGLRKADLGVVNPPGRRRGRDDGARFATFECVRHGVTEFVLEGRGYYRCKRCRAAGVSKRRRVVKRRLIEEAGGACVLCGYRRWPGALQFHHVDPTHKEFHIAHRGYSRSLARSRTEAEKCVLLCANCHSEVEGGFATLPVDLVRARSKEPLLNSN